MHFERWSHNNQWLNEFKLAFVRDTRGWVRQLEIETDDDVVTICGRVNSFYAVQLAIQAIRKRCQVQAPFAAARLALVVADFPVELQIVHPPAAPVAKHPPAAPVAKHPSPRARARRSKLTAV